MKSLMATEKKDTLQNRGKTDTRLHAGNYINQKKNEITSLKS